MLSKIWYWGWRNLTTGTKAVSKPEDLAGLKIRVPESPVWVEMIRAMGAAPTPIPFGEVYTALQQKTVDGQENPIPTIYSRKFYEVQAHLSMTRHMLQNNTMVINKRSFEKLTPEQQKIVLDEAAAVSARTRSCSRTARSHAGGHPQDRQDGDRRQARPRRVRRQDGAGDGEARGALGCGQPEARPRSDRRVQARSSSSERKTPVAASARAFGRVDDGVAAIEDLFLIVAHGGIAGLVLLAVVLRYVFNDPLTWGEELIVGLFTWMVFIGAAAAVRTQMHIRIDVMAPVYANPKMNWLNAVTLLIGIAIIVVDDLCLLRAGAAGSSSVESPMLSVSKAWFAAVDAGRAWC